MTVEDAVRGIAAGQKNKIGVCVSGGMDSMVLLHALCHELGPASLVCIHFEHGIRGLDSVRDMNFVQAQSQKLGVRFACERRNVPAMAQGQNLEETARKLRYEFFERVRDGMGLEVIATAHHADDLAETMLLNLTRGCGLAGLATLRGTEHILRPLLYVPRADIERYAEENAIAFVTDATNSDTEYSRNLIRAIVLPALKKVNPAAIESFARGHAILSSDNDALDSYAAGLAESFFGGVRISVSALQSAPEAVAMRALRIAVKKTGRIKDVEQRHLNALMELAASGRTGSIFRLPGRFIAQNEYGYIAFYSAEAPSIAPVALQVPGITYLPGGCYITAAAERPKGFFPDSEGIYYIDGDALKGAVVRTRLPGDTFSPLGMNGTKTLSDWMTDKKLPHMLRDSLPAVFRGEKALLIPKFAVAEELKLRADTKNIIMIKYSEEN